ncbi:MAG: hypothetical protein Q9Q13_12030 [Acidobacteriota bacterium]|nr:hypothetical protein [Acidobacteriota bacterium]
MTDTDEEFDALVDFIRDTGARVLQCRNLNIDPDLYLEALGMEPRKAPGFGIDRWMDRVRQAFPHLCFAYFNPPREEWPAPSPPARAVISSGGRAAHRAGPPAAVHQGGSATTNREVSDASCRAYFVPDRLQ